jgi:predicted enzyme related to lactoylglutathione lyase
MDLAWTFYEAVLGWSAKESDTGDMKYVEFTLGGRSVAGMMAQDPSQAGMPSYWMPYFQPADIDKMVGEATALGARVMVPKMAIPGGEFAVLVDPQGAAFGLFRPDAATPTDS